VQYCFFLLGGCAIVASFCAIAVRFSPSHKAAEEQLYAAAIEARRRSEGAIARLEPSAG
jgi:hypothetical protein